MDMIRCSNKKGLPNAVVMLRQLLHWVSYKTYNNTNSAKDFEVLVGGQSLTIPETLAVNANNTTTVIITLTTAIDGATFFKGITLKALTSLDVVDDASNILIVPNITITQ